MSVAVCPKGHASSDAEFCSDCGVRLGTADRTVEAPPTMPDEGYPAAAYAGEICPDCGTPRDESGTVFCEVCGFNFATGAHGEIPEAGEEPQAPAPVQGRENTDAPRSEQAVIVAPAALRCALLISAEPGQSPEAAVEEVAPQIMELTQDTNLIGRRDAVLGIAPEVELAWDDAVSRRHAVVQRAADGGWTVRDIGAANGTELNGVLLPPLQDQPLQDGDVLRLGRRARIEVRLR